MRIGIRTKLIILLVAVALLPLLGALLTIVIGGRQLRSEIYGQGFQSLVRSEARVMQTELEKDIKLITVALREEPVIGHLLSSKAKLPDDRIAQIERDWKYLTPEDKELADILVNNTSRVLRLIRDENRDIAEILVTDRFGQLMAATQRTNDFYQADESWWQMAYQKGAGQIYIPEVDYDHSAGVWGLDLCIPIQYNGEIIGIAKAVVDLSRWVPDAQRELGSSSGQLLVVDEEGYVLHSRRIIEGHAQPRDVQLSIWDSSFHAETPADWTVTEDDKIIAYAPVTLPGIISEMPVRMANWYLVLEMPVSAARQGLAQLTVVMVLIGLACILALFLGGVLLIDRSIINRMRHISEAARHVAEGQLQYRADSQWAGTRVFGTDEIDDLSRDFNNMVRKLQRSNIDLQEANELKENFIRIAGHELRTPVSYIVGMASLMKGSDDPERLRKAVDTMGFKATRLDEIIQAMFKLIPEQALAEGMQYEDVNLSKLLEQVYTDLQPWVGRRDQTLVIDPGDSDTIIQADRAKLRDIVENLAMNAVKFTPDGGTVKICTQRQLGGHVSIEVIDEGPGIPEVDRPHVFEPFYSGSDVLKHSTGKSGYGKRGMGLGLAIVRHFVDLHGGTIEFATGPNGTTFVVQLPLEPPSSRKGAAGGG